MADTITAQDVRAAGVDELVAFVAWCDQHGQDWADVVSVHVDEDHVQFEVAVRGTDGKHVLASAADGVGRRFVTDLRVVPLASPCPITQPASEA